MANQEHLDILKRGVGVWNAWREIFPKVRPDLRGADLSKTDLSKADLSKTDLSKADLSGANLSKANLISSQLFEVNLSDADLSYADLSYADLSGAILIRADLFSASLIAVKLDRADFNQATMMSTVLGELDFSMVRGLENVTHFEPSIISIDTIYRSQGKIPDVFLQGAGVPETFITYIHSLVGKPIDYYNCFISYSSKDQDFAERLYADLQSKGVRCWFAPKDLKIGEEFRSSIDESIRLHDKLMVILSQHSINSSWVEFEVKKALQKEQEQGKLVLFPLKLDETIMETPEAWAADIRKKRHIGDFTKWKEHDAYQKAFDRLLRDLRAEAPRRL